MEPWWIIVTWTFPPLGVANSWTGKGDLAPQVDMAAAASSTESNLVITSVLVEIKDKENIYICIYKDAKR